MRRALVLVFTLAGVAPPLAAAGRPDVVLVTIDTWRWDATGWSGASPSPTPELDALGAAGRIFTRVRAHNVVTLPSHANLLTGLYPYQHGVRDNSGFRLPASIPTLATVLRDAGYSTGGFVAAYPLDSIFGLDRGFDVYDDRYPKGGESGSFAVPERRGEAVVGAALAWWRRAPRPRFLFVHLYDPHAPYEPPPPYAARFADPYLAEVAAADGALAPLLAELRAGPEGSAIVAVTADHGEARGDHGELTHGLFAYDATLRVPLLLWGAGVAPGRDDRPARHVDLFPTLLAAAGVATAAEPLPRPGRSLLSPSDDSAPVSYFEALSAALNRGWAPLRGVVRGDDKWISLPLPELYDLAADPAESVNLVESRRRDTRALAALLPVESTWPPPRLAAGSEESSRLASLGYLSGGAEPAARAGPEDDPKRLLALDRKVFAALERARDGDTAAAIALAREVVAARPTMAFGHSLLAQTLLDAGERDAALTVMLAAREHGAASDSLLVQLGLTLSEAGRASEAIQALTPVAERGEPRALVALALAQADAGRPRDAEALLARALAIDPEDPKAYEHLSLVALRERRWADARDAARRALALDESMPRAWNDLGVALFGLGDRSGAVDAWERAVRLDPRLWDALWNLGTQAAALGRTALARAALSRFAEQAPRDRFAADIGKARALLAELAERR